MIKSYIDKCKKNRMHVICFAITVVSMVMGLFFPNAIPRLLESIRDLLTSFAYYLVYLVTDSNNPVPPTILQPQGWFIASEVWEPVQLFPSSIAEFLNFWGSYFGLVFNFEYFRAYLNLIGDCLVYIVKLLMPLLFLVVYLIIRVNIIKTTHCTERNKKSKQLIAFENKWFEVTGKIKSALNSFIAFLSENTYYVIIWLAVWLLYFNAFSIVVSFVAYYLYFIASFNVFSLYGQILKLQTDLTPVIRFIPGIVWAVIIFAIYDAWCKSIAEERIRYSFRANKAFLRQRGISTVLFGKMGTMKTLSQVEMAVTLQDMKFGDAYDTMIEFEHCFINFPWQNLRDELKYRIDKRMIVDTISCRKQVSKWSKAYDLIRKKYTFDEYQKYVEKKDIGFTDLTFKYDYSRYKTIYTNGVKLTTLYQAIEEYACAYYVFTVQTSLLFSNISIRSDSVLDDMGNMPFRYNYLLSKDPFERMKNSQYSHIIDIDMIRRGKQVVKDNPKARTILPAIFVMDEMDKEWKNMNELKDVKSNVDEANQKNDGHMLLLKELITIELLSIMILKSKLK